MFSPLTPTRAILGLGALALVAGVIFFFTRPDPKEAFLRDVEEMLQTANSGQHAELLDWISPEAEEMMRNDYMPPATALNWLARRDALEKRSYRFVNLPIFQAGDYAEIEVERSSADHHFDGRGIFSVPFFWREGRWWVAAGFRGDRTWDFQP